MESLLCGLKVISAEPDEYFEVLCYSDPSQSTWKSSEKPLWKKKQKNPGPSGLWVYQYQDKWIVDCRVPLSFGQIHLFTSLHPFRSIILAINFNFGLTCHVHIHSLEANFSINQFAFFSIQQQQQKMFL